MLRELRILVIDDEVSILDVLEEFLRSKGHDVTCRPNGADGLSVLRSTKFDLVISDIKMAGINGFEFLKLARGIDPSLGIVLMTAYEGEYPFSKALQAGADGYISKPFTLNKFSLIFERAYWNALSRQDWWNDHDDEAQIQAGN